jgi:hypothetical protein
MLDPLLYRLAASCSKQVPQETVVHGKPLKTLVYTTKVDFSLVTKLAQSLVVLFHFGGQGLSRTCSSTTLRDTGHLRLKESLTKRKQLKSVALLVNAEQLGTDLKRLT